MKILKTAVVMCGAFLWAVSVASAGETSLRATGGHAAPQNSALSNGYKIALSVDGVSGKTEMMTLFVSKGQPITVVHSFGASYKVEVLVDDVSEDVAKSLPAEIRGAKQTMTLNMVLSRRESDALPWTHVTDAKSVVFLGKRMDIDVANEANHFGYSATVSRMDASDF